jgi:Transglycosylase SLT domain
VCRLATCALLLRFLVAQLHAGTLSAQNMTTQPDAGPAVESQRSGVGSPPPSPDVMCQTLESAAHANDLPLEFLTRLLWQESRFNPDAVSPAGAQGIAQFMPKTGASRGLQNPFDPIQAITKSAETSVSSLAISASPRRPIMPVPSAFRTGLLGTGACRRRPRPTSVS